MLLLLQLLFLLLLLLLLRLLLRFFPPSLILLLLLRCCCCCCTELFVEAEYRRHLLLRDMKEGLKAALQSGAAALEQQQPSRTPNPKP